MWLPIPEFPNYEASDTGDIRSLGWKCKRGSVGAIENKLGKILKPSLRFRRGKLVCLTVNLRINGSLHTERVHRLVLQTFIGPCPVGMEGCHNDGNPANNALSNLRWDTHKSNAADSKVHGTASKPPVHLGEDHPLTKLSESDVLAIRQHPHKRGSDTALGRKYRTSSQTIRRIRLREVWNHI